RATKVARSTIGRGLKDLRNPGSLTGEVRRKGGGTPRLTVKDPTLLEDLHRLLEPATMGDPMRPLRWVSKSHDKLATALRALGHKVSSSTIPKLLEELKYCRHSNRKTKEAGKHPDRDAQFEYINAKVEAFQAAGEPVISIDAKKKELLGEFKNGGSDYGPQGEPIEVNAHDFEDKELGKVVPYGVYDIGANLGYVSLGIDHDTGEFAVNAVRCWLDQMGWKLYPGMRRLMITADGGGSNGSRLRLWKLALQQLADETGLIIQVCHYPPGTSKWNKIEHRMFCHITQNWRATPLLSLLIVIELIANTTTKAGLKIRCGAHNLSRFSADGRGSSPGARRPTGEARLCDAGRDSRSVRRRAEAACRRRHLSLPGRSSRLVRHPAHGDEARRRPRGAAQARSRQDRRRTRQPTAHRPTAERGFRAHPSAAAIE